MLYWYLTFGINNKNLNKTSNKRKKSSRKNNMRKVIEKQLKFGQLDIDKIEIDIQSRDEIPQLLLGLQAIYRDVPLRKKIFRILESIVPENTSKITGRPE